MTQLMWYGDRVEAEVRRRVVKGLEAAGVMLVGKVKKLISTGPGETTRGRNLSAREIQRIHRQGGPRGPRSVVHSKPGEPPFKQSGRLRANVTYALDLSRERMPRLIVGIREGVKYAHGLEFGRFRMKPRPFLRPTIVRNRQNIFKLIVSQGAKGQAS